MTLPPAPAAARRFAARFSLSGVALVLAAAALAAAPAPAQTTQAPRTAAAAAPAGALSVWERADDIAVGSREARVVLIEYGSPLCPACAQFHDGVLPQILQRYVETGRVRYVFRAFPTGSTELALLGGLLARCAGPEGYLPAVQRLMAEQSFILTAAQRGRDPVGAMRAVAGDGGQAMTLAQMQACQNDRALMQTVIDVAREGEERWRVASTPTLIINGVVQRDAEALTVTGLSQRLDAALTAAPARTPRTAAR